MPSTREASHERVFWLPVRAIYRQPDLSFFYYTPFCFSQHTRPTNPTDRSTPQTLYRWTATWVLVLLFVIRIYFAEAYYIVTYALAIYLLSELPAQRIRLSTSALGSPML